MICKLRDNVLNEIASGVAQGATSRSFPTGTGVQYSRVPCIVTLWLTSVGLDPSQDGAMEKVTLSNVDVATDTGYLLPGTYVVNSHTGGGSVYAGILAPTEIYDQLQTEVPPRALELALQREQTRGRSVPTQRYSNLYKARHFV